MENTIKIQEKRGMNIIKGVGIALISTIIALLIFAIILTYSSISEDVIVPVVISVTAISILIGSILGNTKIEKNGILNGGLVGAIYIAILYTISSLLNWKFGLNLQSIIMIIASFICGMLGGVIGVNRKKEK